MNKRAWWLVILLAGLTGVLIWRLSSGGQTQIGVISDLDRPRRFNPQHPIMRPIFGLDREYQINEVWVEKLPLKGEKPPADDGDYPEALQEELDETDDPVMWRMTGDSVPVQTLRYGQNIKGMERDPDRRPRRLEPGRLYRLHVSAEGLDGQVDFKTWFFQEPKKPEDRENRAG